MSSRAFEELWERAQRAHGAGDLVRAERHYREIVARDPSHGEALRRLGVIAFQSARFDEALAHFDRALTCMGDAGEILHLRGLTLGQKGDWAGAVQNIERALKTHPREAKYYNNLGIAYKELNNDGKAMEQWERATAIDPGYAAAYYNMGGAWVRLKDYAKAAACFERACAAQPADGDYWLSLVEALFLAGERESAVASATAATRAMLDDAGLLCRLADICQSHRENVRAIDAYEKAVKLAPDLRDAWYGLGCAQERMNQYASAAESYRRAVTLDGDFGPAHHNLGKSLYNLGRVDEAIAEFRKAQSLLPGHALPAMSIAVAIPGSPAADHAAVRKARQEFAGLMPSAPTVEIAARTVGKRRIGYLSAFFKDRHWMKPVWSLLKHHDRDRYEIHLFSDNDRESVESSAALDSRDGFHEIRTLSNPEVAELIRTMEMDVIVDLNGYSYIPRLPLFSQRLATLVIGWFNHFATTALPGIDVLVGDATVIPPDEEASYTERIARVGGSYLAFQVAYETPEIRAPIGGQRPFTFGSLASQYKITGDVMNAWSEILRRRPESRFLLRNSALQDPGNRAFVLESFVERGVSKDRVDLRGPARHYEFLTTYDELDLSLDTFPYNGGTTTTESLWQGVLVMTFVGDRWVSRTSASLLRAAGLEEFVAKDRTDYVERAVKCATAEGRGRLAELRATMRDRLRESAVCDVASLARDLEAIYG